MQKKFKNIVIASDLDGTYFAKGAKTVERNIERVRYFCDNGGHFTFSTGRLPIYMRRSLPNAAELINMPAVTGNGTCLYDFSAKRSLEDIYMPSELVLELAEYCDGLGLDLGYRVTTGDGFVTESLENKFIKREYEHHPDFMQKRILPRSEWSGFDVYKVNVTGEKEILNSIYAELIEHFCGKLTVTRSGFNAIEVMSRGTSKAVMLKKAVRERFGDNVMLCTVGDEDNDLEMHLIADLPVCPANANEKVKSICKLCLCDHNEGVIGDLVDYLDKNI